ncbi:MAG: dockerin type I domain-containing protein, partial [Tepidisphaerales bacterium]
VRQWVQDGTITGRGIVSSTAPVSPATTIGLADNAMIHQTTWDGQTVSDGTNFKQILTIRALVGDTNLDGKVDQIDYLNIIANMGRVGATYLEGDLNHDGVVTPDDLALVSAHLGAASAAVAGPQLAPAPVAAAAARGTAALPTIEQPAVHKPAKPIKARLGFLSHKVKQLVEVVKRHGSK